MNKIRQQAWTYWVVLGVLRLASWGLVKVLLGLCTILFLADALVWCFERQYYAIGLAPNSPLRETVNHSFMETVRVICLG